MQSQIDSFTAEDSTSFLSIIYAKSEAEKFLSTLVLHDAKALLKINFLPLAALYPLEMMALQGKIISSPTSCLS